jgi:protein-disulfide isomerase
MTFRLRFTAAAAVLLALALPAAAEQSFTDAQKKEIGDIVREYLLANPEILLDVSRELESKQKLAEAQQRESALKANADAIFRSPHDYVAGNPKGDVTMVEFFDYNCGWCKKGLPEVVNLIETDKNLRVVLKEFPIFGGDSDYAAKAAIAAKKQGKYWELHTALLGHEGKVTKQAVDEIAAAQGIDMAKLKADMNSPEVAKVIADNQALAQSLAINGTPAFIIDTHLTPGYLPAGDLMAAIEGVRSGGGCKLC